MSTACGDTVTVTTTFGPTVTAEFPLADASAELVAATVTLAGFGCVAGGVYNPLALMVPTVLFPPVTLFTDQETCVIFVPATVAVNCCTVPTGTVTDVGLTCTVIGVAGFCTVTLADPDARESATLVAVTVMVAGLGKVAGGVYTPEFVIVPTVELPPAVPLTSQVTLISVAPVTAAVNCCVVPWLTVVVAGVTATFTADLFEPEFIKLQPVSAASNTLIRKMERRCLIVAPSPSGIPSELGDSVDVRLRVVV
jgi:hypothetical protein